MNLLDLFVIAVGLSMDAFAVSVCKGLAVKKIGKRHIFSVGMYFGGFQALMPLIGYIVGRQFESLITSIDHWIAFVLLAVIGGNMAREALSGDEDETPDSSFDFKTMLPLAVATSIDALAVGVTFAFLNVSIIPAVLLIGATTFAISAGGLQVGNVFGTRYKSKAELVGGIILICLGGKILIEHLFFGG